MKDKTQPRTSEPGSLPTLLGVGLGALLLCVVLLAISALSGSGSGDLLDAVLNALPETRPRRRVASSGVTEAETVRVGLSFFYYYFFADLFAPSSSKAVEKEAFFLVRALALAYSFVESNGL